MRKHLIPLVFFALAASPAVTIPQGRIFDHPRTGEFMARPVGPFNATRFSATNLAFQAILKSARVPGGMEEVAGCTIVPSTVTQISGKDLRSALNSLIKSDPRYRWTADDDVINLLPKENATPILGIRIESVELENPSDLPYCGNTIFNLPEVRREVARLGLLRGGVQPFLKGLGGSEVRQNQSAVPPLKLRNTDVLSALNAVVRANGRGVWTLNERYCNRRGVYNINFTE